MSEVKINPDPIAAQVLKSIAVEQAFRQYHSHAPLHCTQNTPAKELTLYALPFFPSLRRGQRATVSYKISASVCVFVYLCVCVCVCVRACV